MKTPDWTLSHIPRMDGLTCLVTGANSGIGWHTAFELARAGCEVILTTRSEAKGQDAVDRIRVQLPEAQLRVELLDLASLRSVRESAERMSQLDKLDLLINNAGVMSVPTREVTEDGFERQLATNYLGPFALTALLMPVLKRSKAPRVTTVCSGAANLGLKRIQFEDIQWERSYHPWRAYCQTKLADLMFAIELAERAKGAGENLISNAAHPGYAMTNLQTSGPGRPRKLLARLYEPFISQDAASGALPTLRAATDADAGSGSYVGPNWLFELKGDPVFIPIPPPAQDESARRRLWDLSVLMIGAAPAGVGCPAQRP